MKKYIALLVVLNSCAVGPNYHPPENTVSDTWAQTPLEVSTASPQTDWWKQFSDPLLDLYMEKAAAHNNQLLTAEANILQARALRMVAASSFYPQLESNLNGSKTYFSKNGPVFAASSFTQGVTPTTGLPFQIQVPQIQNLYNALLDASWEIDLFGKIRRTVEAADATIGQTIETRNDVLITILAEIARNYMELRASQKGITLIEKNIKLLETEAKISASQFKTGYTDKIAMETTAASLAKTRAELPELRAQIYRNIYALAVLTGEFPEALLEELLPPSPLPHAPPHIAVGLRSDLLRRRPDVRYAERQLAIATANIGVAVASFYPSVVLTADIGFQALQLKKLFKASSRTWDYGGNIGIPIFEGGNLVGNLQVAESAAKAATYTYQQTVLTALQDTETALISYTQNLSTTRELTQNYTLTHHIAELTKKQYKKGLVGLTSLINSQQQAINAEELLLASQIQTLLNLISLYKALGGGWEPLPEPTSPSQECVQAVAS